MPSQRQLDRLYAAFCRTGDPEALGAVFDATAPELLHLAVWLSGNRTDAEDLLQRTFVQAIERRAQFELGKPVMPWLVGLLGNLAKHLQRERARTLPARAGQAEPDPAQVAADAEFTATVQQRVAAIEAPYRQVLELHLQAGLNAKEIAAQLGRPAGTVRTQLMRALERLRQRLPAGFVAGMLPGVPRAAVLAQVRASVMGKAAACVPAGAVGMATAVAMTGGVLAMKKIFVVVPLLAVLIGAGFLLAPQGATSGMRGEAGATAQTANVATGVRDVGAQAPVLAPEAHAPQRVEVTPTANELATIRGRCVDEHGKPVAGHQVELLVSPNSPSPSTAEEQRVIKLSRATPAIHTTADGAFAFHFPIVSTLRVVLMLGFDRSQRESELPYVPIGTSWTRLDPGTVIDLGDVALPRGVILRGRVRDERAQPIAGASIHLAPKQRGVDGVWFGGEVESDARTDREGAFLSTTRFPPGSYQPKVANRKVLSPVTVEVGAGPQDLEFDLVVQSRAEIRGVVVDENGAAVRRARVETVPPGAFAYTNAEGDFVLVRDEAMPQDAVRLAVRGDKPDQNLYLAGCEDMETVEPHAWGSSNARLVVQRGVALEIRAFAADGTPVTNFKIRFLGNYPWRQVDAAAYELRGLRRQKDQFVVVPGEQKYSPTQSIAVDVRGPSPQVVPVTLPTTQMRTLQVRRADGNPVAGTRIQLADPLGTPAQLVDASDQPIEVGKDRTGRRGLMRLQSITTDADGNARLAGPADRPLDLMLLGPGHAPQIEHAIDLADPTPLTVVVHAGASVLGTLQPPGILRELQQLADSSTKTSIGVRFLQEIDGRTFAIPPMDKPTTPMDGDTFRLANLPTGPCKLALSLPGGEALTETLAQLDLRDGETRALSIDLSHLWPGTWNGTALQNGQPLAGAHLIGCGIPVAGLFGAQREVRWDLVSGEDGAFSVRALPGRYRMRWLPKDSGVSLEADATVIVTRGETTTQAAAFACGKLHVRLLDPDGKPAAGVPFVQRDASYPRGIQQLRITDSRGEATLTMAAGTMPLWTLPRRCLDPIENQALEFEHRQEPGWFANQLLRVGDVVVRPGATTELELRLPPEWSR